MEQGFECKPCNFWENRLATFSMGSKDAPQKMQFLDAIKKSCRSVHFYTKRKSGGHIAHIKPSPKSNRSDSQCSCRIQELMNRGKYAYMNLWVKWAWSKVLTFLGSHPCGQKSGEYVSTFRLSAWLLMHMCIRITQDTLHTYTGWIQCWKSS